MTRCRLTDALLSDSNLALGEDELSIQAEAVLTESTLQVENGTVNDGELDDTDEL
jgi:hypothetical protein